MTVRTCSPFLSVPWMSLVVGGTVALVIGCSEPVQESSATTRVAIAANPKVSAELKPEMPGARLADATDEY